jgi:hypothetical protein
MAYNDFSLETLIEQFGLQTDEQGDYFAPTPPAVISDTLRRYLQRYVPRAIAIGTEKARSEFIIVPVLVEVIDQATQAVSIFSGVEFNPDPERGLRGVCDFLLSLSPEQLTVTAPAVAVVEAKNENVKTGTNQCMAEMLAAQVFNRAKNKPIETVFGAVTTGTNWLFLRLKENTIYLDRTEYYISQPDKIIGILLAMLREASESQAAA